MKKLGKGVVEAIPAGTVGKLEALGGERSEPLAELDLLRRISEESGRPLTFTLVEIARIRARPVAPDAGRAAALANEGGAHLFRKCPRASSAIIHGLPARTTPSCAARPTSKRLAHLPLAERVHGDARSRGEAADPVGARCAA